jgi:RNA polymerase sigma factor (sigma-70 family)
MIYQLKTVLVDLRKVPREKKASDYTDAELITETLNGDKIAYQLLMERHEYELRVYALRTLNFHKENADDVMSVAWSKLYSNLGNYNPQFSFKSWAYKVTYHCCIDFLRKNKRFKTLPITEANENHWSYSVSFDKPDVEEIQQVLNKLKPKERELITLFYLDSLTLDEISKKLLVEKNNLSVRLCRIRKKIQTFH